MSSLRVVGEGSLVEEVLFSRSGKAKGHAPLRLATPEGRDFEPIGPGLPLTVEIAHVYTGKYPVIAKKAPMIVTSAIKNLDAGGAAAEAVNYLVKGVGQRQHFVNPPSDQEGTKLVSYVPAVTAISTNFTFNLVFEIFPDAVFQEIENIMGGAAQIPLFLTQSPYLVGLGGVLKLVQDIGDAIFNGKPNYTPSVDVNFSDIGNPTEAGYSVQFKAQDDPHADFRTFTFDPQLGLIDPKTTSPYDGDAPYFVIAIDGRQRDALKSFAPVAATADLLGTFFNIKDGGTVPVSDILNVVKAANDVDFGKQVVELKKKLKEDQDAGNTQAAAADQKELDAALANIQDPDLAALFKNASS